MKYTETHEWVKQENGTAIVGITRFAQEELGEIVFVELPAVGQKVKMGEEICVIESTKAAADIYAPISGTVLSVNEKLKRDLTDLNHSPEKEGWLYTIAIEDPTELGKLLDLPDYEEACSIN